jgi:hypothetical protein
VLRTYAPNHQAPRFVYGDGWNLDKVRIIPEILCLDEVDTMLPCVGTTLLTLAIVSQSP